MKKLDNDTLMDMKVHCKIDFYDQPWRDFHSWEHIETGLTCFLRYFSETEEGNLFHDEIILAWLLHDAVYIPGFAHNEEASAQLVSRYGAIYGYTRGQIVHVQKLIMQTKGHLALTCSSPPGAAIINDMDLHGMGNKQTFKKNSIAVKNEYCLFVSPVTKKMTDDQQIDFALGQFCFFLAYYNLFPILFKTDTGKKEWQPVAKELIAGQILCFRRILEDAGFNINETIDSKFKSRSFLFKRLNESVE